MSKAMGLSALLRADDDPADSKAGRRAAKDAILQYFRAVASRDQAALTSILAEDAVYEIPFSESGSTDPGQYRRYSGRDSVVAFWMETLKGGLKSLGSSEVELSITPDGHRVFIEQRGDILMPDGKSYRNRYVFRFTIAEGKVKEVREYYNPDTAAYAFGRKIAHKYVVDSI